MRNLNNERGMIPRRVILATCITFVMVAPSFANNNYFIPGDAFFYFEIEQSEWADFKSGELSTINYDRPDHLPFMLCGYAGYQKLNITNLPKEYRGRLVRAVESMKELYPTKIVEIDHGKPEFFGSPSGIEKKEINKIRIFVYNKTFDFAKYQIGLKYNEAWPESAVALGHSKKHFQFDFFVNTPKGITESWRIGTDVDPLNVKLPPGEKGFIKTPITIDPKKLKFLVAPPTSLESLCFPTRDSSIECFVVSNDGVQSLTVDKSGKTNWKLTKKK